MLPEVKGKRNGLQTSPCSAEALGEPELGVMARQGLLLWLCECWGQARGLGAGHGTVQCFGFSFLLRFYSEQAQVEEDAELFLLGHISPDLS